MAKTKTLPWDAADHLETEEDMAAYIEAVLEECDAALIAIGPSPRADGEVSRCGARMSCARQIVPRVKTGSSGRRIGWRDVHIADADAADLVSMTEIYERAERLLERNVRVDRVELIQIAPLKTEPAQAAVACPH